MNKGKRTPVQNLSKLLGGMSSLEKQPLLWQLPGELGDIVVNHSVEGIDLRERDINRDRERERRRKDEGACRREESNRRKDEGAYRREESNRRKDEGACRREEESNRRKDEESNRRKDDYEASRRKDDVWRDDTIRKDDTCRRDDIFSHLRQNLNDHQQYYEQQIKQQKASYVSHFRSMADILRQECYTGLNYIDNCLQKLKEEFSHKRAEIVNLSHEIRKKDKYHKDFDEKRIEKMLEGASLRVELVDLQLGDLGVFREEAKKYVAVPVNSQQIEGNEEGAGQAGKCQDVQEQGTQTEAVATVLTAAASLSVPAPTLLTDSNSPNTLYPSPDEQMDEMEQFLSCHQELGHRLSASARRRRKYAVGRRDVIREQDQFSENSLVSES